MDEQQGDDAPRDTAAAPAPGTSGSRRAALGGVAGGLALAAGGLLGPGGLLAPGAIDAADRPARQRRKQGGGTGLQPEEFCLNCWHLVRWVNVENKIPYSKVLFEVSEGYFNLDQVGGYWYPGPITHNIGQMSMEDWHSGEFLLLRVQGGFRKPPGQAYFVCVTHTGGFVTQDRKAWLWLGVGGTTTAKGGFGWLDEMPYTGKLVVEKHELHEHGHYDWKIDGMWFRVARLADDPSIRRGGFQCTLTVQSA